MLAVLKTVLYIPLYNGLIFLIWLIPGSSVAVAVVLFTILVKLLLFPLSYKASKFQFEMRMHEGEIAQIKERYKTDKQAEGKAVLDFYRTKKINPFAGILPIFIQIPLIIALYYVFYGGGLPSIDPSLLYHGIPIPTPDMHSFGFDIGAKSIALAVLTALTQFLQAHFAMPPQKPRVAGTPASFGDDMARGMQFQVKYILPVFIGFVAYQVSGAVALYFITSNLFAVGQEVYLRKRLARETHLTHA